MKQSFRLSELPKDWKIAYITPIHKNGNRLNAENYRPISLTSICSKVMERIIWNQMFRFLNDQSILSANQHGFLPGRSTVTCLLQCLNTWTISLDQNKPVDIINLDFEKAFDRVPHRRLLYKLEIAGIRGLLLRWIEAFLKNRSFSVKVGSLYSTKRTVLSGVPQGSVLGPILFVLYISDLLALIKSSHSFYADD
ncbi:reverse transcriptase family protein, partial [Enterobacter cloacae complex sp. 2DZ2F20B]|uniref:RNA-directed DNA polymerase n=1 Tax=Enterobacter cloacae complex sp. 2DZ2F20B TaxID=2511993 RepID=UPI001027A8AA